MRKWLVGSVLVSSLMLPLAAFAQATPTPVGEPVVEATTEVTEETQVVPPLGSTVNTTPISIGDTVVGELTEEEPVAYYAFTGEADTLVTITHRSEDFDSYLVLLDADMVMLATNDDGAGDLDSLITFTLPEDGEYIIQVDSYGHYNGSTAGVGEYELSLATIEQDVIEYGEVVDGDLTTSALEAYYVFRGSAGDSVSITMISDDFDTYLYLYDEDGFELAYNDDGAGNLDSRIGPFTLPSDGDYRITATSLSHSSTGSFTLSLNMVSLEQIAFGDTATGEISGGSPAYFSFDAAAGDVINISVDSEADTNMTLSDPYGYVVISDEDGGAGNNPEITDYVVSSEGTYTIAVGSTFAEAASFELSLSRAEIPSLNDGPLTLNFSSSGNSRTAVFTAEAGQTITLTLAASTEFSPNVDILQGGSSLSYGSASYVTGFSLTLTVPDDGEVRFNINDYSYTSVTVTASVEVTE